MLFKKDAVKLQAQQKAIRLKQSYQHCKPIDLYKSALTFAAQSEHDCARFLKAWCDRDWRLIASEFPDYNPPAPPSVPLANALHIQFGSICTGGEHPTHTQFNWLVDACNGQTLDGYWEWVRKELLREQETN